MIWKFNQLGLTFQTETDFEFFKRFYGTFTYVYRYRWLTCKFVPVWRAVLSSALFFISRANCEGVDGVAFPFHLHFHTHTHKNKIKEPLSKKKDGFPISLIQFISWEIFDIHLIFIRNIMQLFSSIVSSIMLLLSSTTGMSN